MKAAVNALNFKEEQVEATLKADETKHDGMDESKAIDGNLTINQT